MRGAPRDYAAEHPARPALIVEVADSGLRLARGRKAEAYARAMIADYWIVNLADRVVEIRRQPQSSGTGRRAWGYAGMSTFDADATITPLATPAARISVADLLPWLSYQR